MADEGKLDFDAARETFKVINLMVRFSLHAMCVYKTFRLVALLTAELISPLYIYREHTTEVFSSTNTSDSLIANFMREN